MKSILSKIKILVNAILGRYTQAGQRYDIVLVGSFQDRDLLFAERFSSLGLKCAVLRRTCCQAEEDNFTVEYFDTTEDFFKKIAAGRMVISICNGLYQALGGYWRFYDFLHLPPFMNMCTGSDITELSIEDSPAGARYRHMMRRAAFSHIPAYPKALENMRKLGDLPYNFFQLNYDLTPVDLEVVKALPAEGETLRFFHFAHIDWAESDAGKGRASTKGTDRFLKGFIRAVTEGGLNAHCVILDRGSDKELAKQMIKEKSAQAYFTWKPAMQKNDFIAELDTCDVVVDQFDVGGLGAGAGEAMARAKPVMTYMDEECMKLAYRDDHAPILNCRTEEEIYDVLMRCGQRDGLKQLGLDAYEWIARHHGWNNDMSELLGRLSALGGFALNSKKGDHGSDN